MQKTMQKGADKKLRIIDMHQDLMLYISRPELYQDKHKQTSFEQIKKSYLKVVVASVFVVPEKENFLDPAANRLMEESLKDYRKYCAKHPEFMIIKDRKDLKKVLVTDGLYGLILHIEGLNVFDVKNDWEMLERFYSLGLRSIGPMWNINNPFGGGTLDSTRGLTELGKKLIAWCEKKGVIFDCAHMNEQTFWDAAKITTRPIMVSHGNARSVLDNVRNYSDRQLQHIAKTRGVIGIFFSKRFLAGKKKATIDTVKKHVDHIIRVGGEDSVAIGSDFGGITSGFPERLRSVDDLPRFLESMEKSSKTSREKIAWKNALRVLSAHLS
jgi:membrane dipeptidase